MPGALQTVADDRGAMRGFGLAFEVLEGDQPKAIEETLAKWPYCKLLLRC